VTSSGGKALGAVTIRDRRTLPFFQVHLHAVRLIREQSAGPRRVRAIGFYALLCELANEQRHIGEHRRVHAGYEELSRRGRMSKRTVKQLLDILQDAGVVRHELVNDRERAATVSIFHLLIHEGSWTAITVAMASALASDRQGGHLLRDMGMIVVLLEFCAAQRERHGGQSAEVLRSDISERSGLTVDRVDDCSRVLERVGVLTITRRRAANGGRNLANVYTIIEAPQGGVREPPEWQTGTDSAVDEYPQGGMLVPAARLNGTDSAAGEFSQHGNAATTRTETPPSRARVETDVEEKDIEHLPFGSDTRSSGGEGRGLTPEEELCEALIAAWRPALGETCRDTYQAQRAQWLRAARELLARHPRHRLDDAIGYMTRDEILGSQALTMPGLAKVADQLIARAYARRNRLERRPDAGGSAHAMRWPEARVHLESAVQRYGRDNRAAAVEALEAESKTLVEFVDRVRWGVLCEQPFRYAERRYEEIWAELTAPPTKPNVEAAA
jgi:hypothetical protein